MRIVFHAAIIHKPLIKVCIAIDTTVFTSVIRANVYAGNAAAGSTLIFIPLNVEFAFPDSFDPIAVDTACVPDTESTQIDFFRTGIDINAVLFCNFAEKSHKLFDLCGSQRADAKRSHPALDVLVQIKKTDGTFFGAAGKPVTKGTKIFYMVLYCISVI
jgi:hypothetical protein